MTTTTATFTLTSPDIASGARIGQVFEFDGFGCSGQNRSPVLQWQGAPAGTRSFAVTVYDPDAPTGSGWWHWFVVDLPADTTQLAAHAGAQGGAGGQHDHLAVVSIAELGCPQRGFNRWHVVADRKKSFGQLALRLGVDGVTLHSSLPFPD